MKSFFKQYSYNIVKNLINQFAISIFGALLSMVMMASSKTHNVWAVIVSIFSVAFYLFLIYTTTWEIGAKDRISVDVGKKEYKPLTGLLISLFANIPNIILAIILLVTRILSSFAFVQDPATSFENTMSKIISGINFVASAVTGVAFQGMYSGILMIKIPTMQESLAHQWWPYFIIVIPALVTAAIAYNTGYKNFRLIAPLFDKKNKNKK